jgi:pyruvate/2-oxoglutarate/acetoin dehydrogenase E1 component
MAIMTTSAAQTQVITEEMRKNPKIYQITGIGVGAPKMVEEFGWDRFRYTGICENIIAGSGVGAALAGGRPIVSLGMADFAQDGWAQIVQQAAKLRFKVANKLEIPLIYTMSITGGPGLTVHHSGSYHNWLANTPGLMVAIPTTPADVMGIWRWALRMAKDPIVILSAGGGVEGPVPDDPNFMITPGKADIKREGKDVTIVAMGYWLPQCLEVAANLAKEGISVEVWDPRTLTPLDRESLIASVKKTGALVVVDQAPVTFGTTGEFMALVAENLTPVPPMARVATGDFPIGAFPTLKDYVYPTQPKIIKAVKDVLARKK